MSKRSAFFGSSHIQIALASGSSILMIACWSGFVVKKPMNAFLMVVPPLIEVAYEYFVKKDRDARICTTWYWVAAILGSTALILLVSWLMK